MPYTLLMIKGHSLNNRPLSQMTRKQIIAHIKAIEIETETQKRARRATERGRRR